MLTSENKLTIKDVWLVLSWCSYPIVIQGPVTGRFTTNLWVDLGTFGMIFFCFGMALLFCPIWLEIWLKIPELDSILNNCNFPKFPYMETLKLSLIWSEYCIDTYSVSINLEHSDETIQHSVLRLKVNISYACHHKCSQSYTVSRGFNSEWSSKVW